MERFRTIDHGLGFPVRVPVRTWREISAGTRIGSKLEGLIGGNQDVELRCEMATLPNNAMDVLKNIRLARVAAGELAEMAEQFGFEHYSVVLRGSTATGLVRPVACGDASDIDLNLVVDGHVTDEQRWQVRNWGYDRRNVTGVKVDALLFPMSWYFHGLAAEGRNLLRNCAMPLKEKGGVYREIHWASVESIRFLSLGHRGTNSNPAKKVALKALCDIAQNRMVSADCAKSGKWPTVEEYLAQAGVMGQNGVDQELAAKLCDLFSRQENVHNMGEMKYVRGSGVTG